MNRRTLRIPLRGVLPAILPLAFFFLVPVVTAGDTLGDDRVYAQATLLVVQRDAPFYQVEGGTIRRAEDLRRGTAVVGINRESIQVGSESYRCWRVYPTNPSSSAGWLEINTVTPFSVVAVDLVARAASFRDSKGLKADSLPELIRLQGNPEVKQAWQDIESAINENEKLEERERLPEPYFARAVTWASVHNYSASLQDYLTALKYARHSDTDIMSYSAYFERLYSVIDRFQKVPAPPLGKGGNYMRIATEHYAKGYHAFWDGDYSLALQRFDNAIQLHPDKSLYWYYRALTFKRMGDDQRAQCDVLFGAYLEKHSERKFQYRCELARGLSRVQGTLRTWLESYRLGDPSHRLLKATMEGIPLLEPNP